MSLSSTNLSDEFKGLKIDANFLKHNFLEIER